MNIYFLVEGVTEKILYREWLKYLLPNFENVKFYDQVTQNCYYIVGDYGFPGILADGIQNAIEDIDKTQKYDYLVLCVDADEDSIKARENYIYEHLQKQKINLNPKKLKLFIQNRCIETWLLGNQKLFNSRQPLENPLKDYVAYYDISQNDPELMGKYDQDYHADFHEKYLKAIFQAKGLQYSKTKPREAQREYYLKELINRIQQKPQHLLTFQALYEFCKELNLGLKYQ